MTYIYAYIYMILNIKEPIYINPKKKENVFNAS